MPPRTRAGFTARDARWFARHGFNAARIGTLWAGVTPDEPGVADRRYVRKWQRIIDLLAERGIWMQFDFHQDMWHETYGGEGAPDWAAGRNPLLEPTPGDVLPFPVNYWTPEVSDVFDRFWASEGGLLDGWVRAWRIMARRFADQPYSMGYDLLNEPWAGVEWPLCLTNGCPATYTEELQPAFTRALRAIRRRDPDNLVWWEPQQFAGGQPLDTFFTAVDGERNRHALDQARRTRAAPMMSEWGAIDDVRAIEIDAQVADEHLMGWTHWAYKRWNDPTTADDAQGLFRDDADLRTVKRAKLSRLVRNLPASS